MEDHLVYATELYDGNLMGGEVGVRGEGSYI